MSWRPESMSLVRIQALREESNDLAVALADFGAFQPTSHSDDEEIHAAFPELPALQYRSQYVEAIGRMQKISRHTGQIERLPVAEQVAPLSEADLRALNHRLGLVWRQFSDAEERLRRAREEVRRIDQLMGSLNRFAALNLDLKVFRSEHRFMSFLLGTLPRANVKPLSEALHLENCFLHEFHQSGDTAYVVLAVTVREDGHALQKLLETSRFRGIDLPPEFQDVPAKVRADLERELAMQSAEQRDAEEFLEALAADHANEFTESCRKLRGAAPCAQLSETLRARGGLATLAGWVPEGELPRLKQALARIPHQPVLEVRSPAREEFELVPSLMRESRLWSPFSQLVRNYGVPRYGEIDPTPLFAISFLLMFGMMFGDVGHGLVIAGVALGMRRLLGRFTPALVAAGLASAIFGLLYGSIFGYEHVIPALWLSPLAEPMRVLQVAVIWGIGFLLTTNVLRIINWVQQERWHDVLFHSQGIAGILFYLAGLWGISRWLGGQGFGTAEQLAIALPLAAILVYQWKESPERGGIRILVALIEGLDTLIAYLANTLSFLRVAAFSINHVALAFAIFAIAGMLGSVGHWVTILLGNLFILVLEGAIVAIQGLRLEYYEGFSRFFSGGGREFQPLGFALQSTHNH